MSNNLENVDITTSEFSYLKEVVNCNGIAQDELIKNLSIDKAAATRIAQSLEKKELIRRIKNEKNKKFLNVYLTEKGNNYTIIVNDIIKEFYETAFKSFNYNEFQEFKLIIKKINDNFKKL